MDIFTDWSENQASPQQEHHLLIEVVCILQALLNLYEDIFMKTYY